MNKLKEKVSVVLVRKLSDSKYVVRRKEIDLSGASNLVRKNLCQNKIIVFCENLNKEALNVVMDEMLRAFG